MSTMAFYSNMFFFILSLIVIPYQKSPKKIKVEKMEISWEFTEDHVEFTASAPEDGWIAIGFNSENNIVGSNLYMVNVTPTKVNAEDLFVVSVGNPKPVIALGSNSQITNYSGIETKEGTRVKFSLPRTAIDNYHFNLKEGQKIWLICAYSMEDEFDHHSRMRKHVHVTL